MSQIVSMLPKIIQTGIQLLNSLISGIIQAIPQLIAALPQIITSTVNTIIANLPKIIQTGIELLAPCRAAAARFYVPVDRRGYSARHCCLDPFFLCVHAVFHALGIIRAIPSLVAALPQVFSAIINAFKGINWADLGKNIIDGVINGVKNAASSLINVRCRSRIL